MGCENRESSGSGTVIDYATIKYNSSGDSVWVKRYNSLGNSYDGANSIAVDTSGNVYVTGYNTVSGIQYDYATIKYNSSGDSVWVKRYNGLGNSYDGANSIAVDTSGNVYVTGYNTVSGIQYDYATLKYNSSGDSLWVKRYKGPVNSSNDAFSIALDGSGNV
jgi:alpha-tubulin suppressor-like RCC1 family protein